MFLTLMTQTQKLMTVITYLINCCNVVDFVDTDREIRDTNNFFEDEPGRTYVFFF